MTHSVSNRKDDGVELPPGQIQHKGAESENCPALAIASHGTNVTWRRGCSKGDRAGSTEAAALAAVDLAGLPPAATGKEESLPLLLEGK